MNSWLIEPLEDVSYLYSKAAGPGDRASEIVLPSNGLIRIMRKPSYVAIFASREALNLDIGGELFVIDHNLVLDRVYVGRHGRMTYSAGVLNHTRRFDIRLQRSLSWDISIGVPSHLYDDDDVDLLRVAKRASRDDFSRAAMIAEWSKGIPPEYD